MSDMIEMDGEVVKSIKDVISVKIDSGEQVLKCHLGGKMRKNKINVIEGDRVRIKVSPYDLNRGIIVLRYKKNKKTRNA
jgi:translation initiation factor IF-1